MSTLALQIIAPIGGVFKKVPVAEVNRHVVKE